jgi:hypothetical protein
VFPLDLLWRLLDERIEGMAKHIAPHRAGLIDARGMPCRGGRI